ncbi:MAG: metabolite traffic protein EboE [Verrucomicrobiota bacterium]
MKISAQDKTLDLSYCLNIHRGESWRENLGAIEEYVTEVKAQVCPDQPFGLGLRISDAASRTLADPSARAEAKAMMRDLDLYAFTVNGFPFGTFHDTRVKENVYAPDWRTEERRDYTNRLTDIMADLVPSGATGSVSTVPCSFKPWIKTEEDVEQMVCMICDCALHMHRVEDQLGQYVHLGLEPEPCCYLETTDEFLAFYKDALLQKGTCYLAGKVANPEALLRRHVGINFDCCHIAIQFEGLDGSLDRLIREGVLLSKIHVSAALACQPEHVEALAPFDEPVYFHQVKAMTEKGIKSWDDLPLFLEDFPHERGLDEMRVHFHVPLFWEGSDRLGSTNACMDAAFWERVRSGACEHLEIETYTFDVLPGELRKSNVVESIVPEFAWTLDRLNGIA